MRVLASRYELLEPSAPPGATAWWRGRDRELGRSVVVELLPAGLAGQDGFRDRFREHAGAAAGLAHRGAAVLYDAGVDDGTAFLVREPVGGRTLAEVLRDGRQPWQRAVALVGGLADVLAHARAHGLTLGGIEPSKVVVTEADDVKVVDFGTAAAVAGTETRSAAGDAAVLGRLLYHLLTGEAPDVAAPHVTPSALAPGIPAGLDALAARALAPRPGDAVADAGGFLAALRSGDSPVGAPAAPAAFGPPPAVPLPRPAEPPARLPHDKADSPRRFPRIRFTPDSLLALFGCLLLAVYVLSGNTGWSHETIGDAAKFAWVAGLATLLWAPQVSAALVWGFVLFSNYEGGSADTLLATVLPWCAAAAVCLWLIWRGAELRGSLTVVAAWMVYQFAASAVLLYIYRDHYLDVADDSDTITVLTFWPMYVVMLVLVALADIRENRTPAA